MRRLFMFVLLSSVFMTTACASHGGKANVATEQDLLHHNFIFETFNGEHIDMPYMQLPMHIEFNENMRVHGRMCNIFNGTATLNDGVIKAMLASTMMLCPDEDVNKVENAFFAALNDGAKINIDGDALLISTEVNSFVFKRSDYIK